MSNPSEANLSEIALSAALERTYRSDQRGFLNSFARLAEGVMPDVTEVTTKAKHLFSSEKTVTAIAITLDTDIYVLAFAGDHHPLKAQRLKIVKGITLKTDDIPVSEWLNRLSEELHTRAKESEEAHFAMANFLEVQRM
jgi:hypothetical protein